MILCLDLNKEMPFIKNKTSKARAQSTPKALFTALKR